MESKERSLVQASRTKGGRETELQHKGWQRESATLAKTWATWFASCLTQRIIHKLKCEAKSWESEVWAWIFQGHSAIGEDKASMHNLESLSTQMNL